MREAVLRQRGIRDVLYNFILMNLDQSTIDVQSAIAVANPTKTEWIFDEVVDLQREILVKLVCSKVTYYDGQGHLFLKLFTNPEFTAAFRKQKSDFRSNYYQNQK
jgi:hypothetical protein